MEELKEAKIPLSSLLVGIPTIMASMFLAGVGLGFGAELVFQVYPQIGELSDPMQFILSLIGGLISVSLIAIANVLSGVKGNSRRIDELEKKLSQYK